MFQNKNQLRSYIQAALVEEYDKLLFNSLNYLKTNFENYRRVSFVDISDCSSNTKLDFDSCINFIIDSKKDIKNTTFGNKSYTGNTWEDNEIKFPFSFRMPEIPEWGSEAFLEYRKWNDALQYICKDEFWKSNKATEAFNELSSINIFDDKIVNQEELPYYKNISRFLYQKEIWLDFIRHSLEYHFSKFKYSNDFSTKKIQRFLTPINNNTLFGFEYEVSDIIRELKQGTPSLPDYLNLILIRSSFEKKDKNAVYDHDEHSSILSLGILGNPFFYPPCYPLLGFSAVDTYLQHQEGNPYLYKIIKLDNDKFKFSNPSEYGESMKRHAFFYLDLLASTSQTYLDYLYPIVSNIHKIKKINGCDFPSPVPTLRNKINKGGKRTFMRQYAIFLSLVILIIGCKHSLNSFQITVDGVFSRDSSIAQFSISQYKSDHLKLNDIRPQNYTELMRYCCELKIDRNGNKKVLFKKDNSNYRWSLCKLDTSIVANDSLNALTFKDKLRYLKKRDKEANYIPNDDMKLPFVIKRGYVYQIFGLPGLDGSCYFSLNADGKLIVQFFDSGPW